jgi:DNA-binding beta-propeller fold protein YncE
MQRRWLGCSWVLALVLAGCGSSSQNQPPPPKKQVPKFAYVANYGSANVSAFGVSASTGALSPLTGSPYAAGGGPISTVLDPKSRFLYVLDPGSLLSVYSISTGGGLTEIAGSPFAIGLNAGG